MHAPMHEPMQFIDPIQEICSTVKAPDCNGESSVDNFANAGAAQPVIVPYANTTRFAVNFPLKSNSKII